MKIVAGIFIGFMLTLQSAISPGRNTGYVVGTPSSCGAPVTAFAMNEGTGTSLLDSSGNSNTATTLGAGALTWTPNVIVTGVTSPVWNGNFGAATGTASFTNFDNTQPFTVGLWVQTSASAAAAFLGNLNSFSNFQGWEIGSDGAGASKPLTFYLINTAGSNWIQWVGTRTINDGALHSVVVTVDGSSNVSGVVVYIDGTVDAPTTAVSSLTATTISSRPLFIGVRVNATNFLTGPMAYAEIWACKQSPAYAAYFATSPRIL